MKDTVRIGLTLVGLVLGVSATTGDKARAQDEAPITVLELFTSQGCSSCPPADALLGELAKRDGVLALTLPVNYWDYLGWKDTLASEGFGKRQRGYAEARGDHEIYTPQLIVNGLAHVVGSREDDVDAAIERSKPAVQPNRVAMKLDCDAGDAITVKAGAMPAKSDYRTGTVWVALYTRAVKVAIRRGENDGREILYSNVVRQLLPAGRWDGQASTYRVMRPSRADTDGCAAFLQSDKADKQGPIIGAVVMAPKTN